jgi:transcriptional regulator with XRE-family HTH domain
MGVFKDPFNTAKCLRESMKIRQITGTNLARKIGVHKATISQWRGNQIPKHHLDLVAGALDYTRSEFLKLGE